MSTSVDPEYAPVGRGDGSNPAAEAQHCADIADMMACRAEAHAGHAKNYAEIAQRCCATVESATERSGSHKDRGASGQVYRTVYGPAVFGLGIVAGIALSMAGYLLIVGVVHQTVGISHERVVYDQDYSTPTRPHYATDPGSDSLTTGEDTASQGAPITGRRSGKTVAVDTP